MVSRYKRHLSLFLVIVLVMSWFVVPDKYLYVAKAADSSETTELFSKVRDNKVTPVPEITHEDFNLKVSEKVLVHRFKINLAADIYKDKLFGQEYTLDDSVNIYAGCLNPTIAVGTGAGGTSNKCSSTDTNKFNFSTEKNDTYSFRAQAYRFKDFASRNTPILIRYENLIYGFYYPNSSDNQLFRLANIDTDDPNSRNTLYSTYINFLNTKANGSRKGTLEIDNNLNDGDLILKVRSFFKELTNDKDNSIYLSNANGQGDFDLIDNPNDETGDIDPKDGKPDPVKPPILRIRGSKFKMNSNIDVPLTDVVRSPERFGGQLFTQNNYFLFGLKSARLSEEDKNVFEKAGINPNIVYLAIDISGNILVLVDDKTKNGGIFSSGKKTFDPNEQNNLIALGKADGARLGAGIGKSKNLDGKPLTINLRQYKEIITQRVYNDFKFGLLPAVTSLDGECVSNPLIKYPKRNTSYDNSSPPIPTGGSRKCINADPDGWLKTWGVEIHRIDQDPVDDCEKAFGGERGWLSFLTNAAAKSICFILGVIINSATWMAGYSIDFLLKTISLQVR